MWSSLARTGASRSATFHAAARHASHTADLVVIGGGPAGYVGSIKAAQMGMKVVNIERRTTLGGTCLNVGCIPSKALLHASEMYYGVTKGKAMAKNGIKVGSVELDLGTMMKNKEKSVAGLTTGIKGLFKKNKVTGLEGHGTITGPNSVQVTDQSGKVVHEIEAKNIMIAVGSEPSPLPGVKDLVVDEKLIVTSTGALSLDKVPKKMIVVGGGVIGLELGSVWAKLGSEVKVVEFMDTLMPFADKEVATATQKILKKQGLKFALATKVVDVKVNGNTATVSTQPAKGGDTSTEEVDCVLVAVGRRPYTESLGLDSVGIKTGRGGFIDVNTDTLATSVPNIYAVGDAITGPMLAHKAEEDAVFVVESIAGAHAHLNWDSVPSVIYTHPEVAWVGRNEEELKAAGVDYKKGFFPMMANSRARANDEAEGFVKVLVEKENGRILGAHLIGIGAGEMVLPLTIGYEYGASAEDIARTCTAHPTFSEAIKEACLAAVDKPIHF